MLNFNMAKYKDARKDVVVERFLSLLSSQRINITDVYLFGSRCRDDWKPDSDYDLLIVIREKDRVIIDKLYDIVMDVLLETGKLVSLKIFSLSEFNRLRSIPTPFMQNVINEGIRLGNRY